MKTEKCLIVQPHSDDALFCCSHILFQPQYEVQVLTVENDPKRIAEDEKLYDFLNIPFFRLTANQIKRQRRVVAVKKIPNLLSLRKGGVFAL